MSGNSLKEKYLIFRAKNKDPEAFARLYDLYAERLYRFIYFKVSGEEEAQDITSEVFLKTWQYILDGKDIENLNALFYKIARNLVIDHYRKTAQRKEASLDETIATEDLGGGVGDDRMAVAIERGIDIQKITEQVRDLKDEYREVVVLRYMNELSIAEISAIIGKKPSAVRVLIYRALQTLKETLDDEQKGTDRTIT